MVWTTSSSIPSTVRCEQEINWLAALFFLIDTSAFFPFPCLLSHTLSQLSLFRPLILLLPSLKYSAHLCMCIFFHILFICMLCISHLPRPLFSLAFAVESSPTLSLTLPNSPIVRGTVRSSKKVHDHHVLHKRLTKKTFLSYDPQFLRSPHRRHHHPSPPSTRAFSLLHPLEQMTSEKWHFFFNITSTFSFLSLSLEST